MRPIPWSWRPPRKDSMQPRTARPPRSDGKGKRPPNGKTTADRGKPEGQRRPVEKRPAANQPATGKALAGLADLFKG